jgi:hypothetical protein
MDGGQSFMLFVHRVGGGGSGGSDQLLRYITAVYAAFQWLFWTLEVVWENWVAW